jgi:hypothetical protein
MKLGVDATVADGENDVLNEVGEDGEEDVIEIDGAHVREEVFDVEKPGDSYKGVEKVWLVGRGGGGGGG